MIFPVPFLLISVSPTGTYDPAYAFFRYSGHDEQDRHSWFIQAQDPRSFLVFIRIKVFKSVRVVQSFGSISKVDIVLVEIAIGFIRIPFIFHLSAPAHPI
jgi:hypothetical protein